MSIDLTQKRDDECIPIVRRLFQSLAKRSNSIVAGDLVSKEELEKYYQQVFAEDISKLLVGYNTRITNIDYIFTMMLQVIIEIKKAMVGEMKQKIDSESVEAAKKVFMELEKSCDTLQMGNTDSKEIEQYYKNICSQSMTDLLKNTNIDYVFGLMTQVVAQMQDQTTKAIASATDNASAKLWGSLDSVDDLRVLHVTNVLADLPLKDEFKEPKSYSQEPVVDSDTK
jgi:hypothetical protein